MEILTGLRRRSPVAERRSAVETRGTKRKRLQHHPSATTATGRDERESDVSKVINLFIIPDMNEYFIGGVCRCSSGVEWIQGPRAEMACAAAV